MDSIADLGTLDRLSVMSCLVSAVLYLYKQGLQIQNISKKKWSFLLCQSDSTGEIRYYCDNKEKFSRDRCHKWFTIILNNKMEH